MTRFGGQNATGTLRRVLLRAPRPADGELWREHGWRAAPEPVELAAEHEALCTLLADAGAEVVLADSPLEPNPDAVYVFDPAIVCDRGAIVLRPGKERRLAEAGAIALDLEAAGVPVAARLEAPATAEGGDTLWLDERTLLVGRGYRTSPAGIEALRDALPQVDVHVFDLPHWHGSAEVMHLLSLLSPLAPDLALCYPPLMPVALVELLESRDIRLVAVPDEEFETMGPNVLALAPRVGLALEGNHVTRERLERVGVEMLTYKGDELSRKGDGGPTCLTRPLLRDRA
jgi:N-dimethylarginine dimethylaminohydrolase